MVEGDTNKEIARNKDYPSFYQKQFNNLKKEYTHGLIGDNAYTNLPNIASDQKPIPTSTMYDKELGLIKKKNIDNYRKTQDSYNSMIYSGSKKGFTSNPNFRFSKNIYNSASPKKKYNPNAMRETAESGLSFSIMENKNKKSALTSSTASLNNCQGLKKPLKKSGVNKPASNKNMPSTTDGLISNMISNPASLLQDRSKFLT